jgi:hypothetical protein
MRLLWGPPACSAASLPDDAHAHSRRGRRVRHDVRPRRLEGNPANKFLSSAGYFANKHLANLIISYHC